MLHAAHSLPRPSVTEDTHDEELDSRLAALSSPPQAPDDDDDYDDDDGMLDLRALASSMAPPAPSDVDPDEDAVVVASQPPPAAAQTGESTTAAAAAVTSATASSTTASAATPFTRAASGGSAASGRSVAATEPAGSVATAQVDPAPTPSGGAGKFLVGAVVLLAVGAIAWALLLRKPGEPELADDEIVAASDIPAAAAPAAPEIGAEAALNEEPNDGLAVDPSIEEHVGEPVANAIATDEPSNDDERPTPTANRTRQAVPTEPTARDPNPSAAATPTEPAPSTMAAEPEPEAQPTMEAEASSMGGNSVEDLLDRAIGGSAPAPAAMEEAPTVEANLPETPSRAAVTRALGGLMPRMRQCAGDQVGIANSRIRVNNDGTVAAANIAGRPFGATPQGQCMEGVLKTARFPRFTRSHFDVNYPFSIRPLN